MMKANVSSQFRSEDLKFLPRVWKGSALNQESTFHQLSPYIGKMKSSMAASLVATFSKAGDVIYDPFCGSGTVALGGWFAGRATVATDLNPYAILLTRAKLFPPRTAEIALEQIERVEKEAERLSRRIDLCQVPLCVRQFFHPRTLRQTVAWTQVLRRQKMDFLLACLMGILHHQRPGFLSFPSSHAVPYLRTRKFPRSEFPELYQPRSVKARLQRKVLRAYRRLPEADWDLARACKAKSATSANPVPS